MLLNTFEHGYSDALHGRRQVPGSPDYQIGYRIGFRHRIADRALTLVTTAVLAALVGGVFAVAISRLVEMPV